MDVFPLSLISLKILTSCLSLDLFTIVLIVVWLSIVVGIPLFQIVKAWCFPIRKMKITGKTGTTAELDFTKKNDVESVLHFADVFLGLK